MKMMVEIDTDTQAVVPREFIGLFEDAFSFLANGHSIGQCFDMMKFARTELLKSQKNQCDGCMAGHELIDGKHYKGKLPYMVCQKHRYSAPQPEQAQQSDFDPIVPEFALEVGAKAVELAMQAGVTSPRTLALAAHTDIALTLHKAGRQPAPRPVLTVTLGKGDKLVADIFQEDEDGILRMAGVGIFDPEPGKVYGIGAKNEAIDGKAITEGNPLILIWSDKPESLQVIVEELQESIARMTRPAEPDGGAV